MTPNPWGGWTWSILALWAFLSRGQPHLGRPQANWDRPWSTFALEPQNSILKEKSTKVDLNWLWVDLCWNNAHSLFFTGFCIFSLEKKSFMDEKAYFHWLHGGGRGVLEVRIGEGEGEVEAVGWEWKIGRCRGGWSTMKERERSSREWNSWFENMTRFVFTFIFFFFFMLGKDIFVNVPLLG